MKKVLAIIGPTASGKTKLSIEVAKRLNGEIISADSRQVYKHIPVSTSYPSEENLKKIRHYFINELNLEEEFNAGEFGKKGREVIKEIYSRNKQPIIVGGSGLYIRSLIDGFFEEEIKSKEVRNELYEKLEKYGEEYLYGELKSIDEITSSKIPKGKIRRVIRALEVCYVSGKKISELQSEKVDINFDTIQIGLMLDREYLYKRINERVDQMIKNGLLEEVNRLKDNSYNYRTYYSLNTVGIKEVLKYFEGEYDYETMIEMIKQNTRRYAKRQITWFRKDKRINWIDVNEKSSVDDLTKSVIKYFRV